jgi:hypothetical protein
MPNPHQFYQAQPVEALGLISPDLAPLGPGTSLANRLVVFLWIRGAAPASDDAQIAIVDVDDPSAVQELVRTPAGESQIYCRNLFLPQGSALSVRGFIPDAGGTITVRLYVEIVDTTEQAALVAMATNTVAPLFGAYRTVYVGRTGNDNNSGRTPPLAKRTITEALLNGNEPLPNLQ